MSVSLKVESAQKSQNDAIAVLIAVARFAKSAEQIDANKDGKKSGAEVLAFLVSNVGNGVTLFNNLVPAAKWWKKTATFSEKLIAVQAFEAEFELSQMQASEAIEDAVKAALYIERAILSIQKALKKEPKEETETAE